MISDGDQEYLPYSLLQRLGSVCIIAATAWITFYPLMFLAFSGDDTFLIRLTGNHSLVELLFYGPAKVISHDSFTPTLGISFYLDHLFFGLSFLARNLHNLFWLVVLGLLSQMVLHRLGAGRLFALFGGITMVISPAAVSTAGSYANRHYLFGLCFALLSLLLVIKWCSSQAARDLGWALFCYFIAICSKEVYVPLLVVVVFVAWRRHRDFKLVFFSCSGVFFFYLILRYLMLGRVVGGYSEHIDWLAMVLYFFNSLPRFIETLVWGGAMPLQIYWPAVVLGSCVILVICILAARRDGLWGMVVFTALMALSLCIVALTLHVPEIRYADDRIPCHGDRFALVFSTVVWLAFWYYTGISLAKKKVWTTTAALLLCLLLIPLTFKGGLAKAHSWQRVKISMEQVEFIEQNVNKHYLVIGEPIWFLRNYLQLLSKTKRAKMQAADFPGELDAMLRKDFDLFVRMEANQPIAMTRDRDKARKWFDQYAREYCTLFAGRCP